MDEGEYFIPHLVGLPEKRFDTFDPQVDHPYFELSEDSFEETMEPATVEVKADELVSAFLPLPIAYCKALSDEPESNYPFVSLLIGISLCAAE